MEPLKISLPLSLTVAEIFALYLRDSEINKRHSPAARAGRERTFRLFADVYGTMPVADLRQFHLSDFVNGCPTWTSADTRSGQAAAIVAVFNWAFREDRIARVPFRAVHSHGERRPDLPDESLAAIIRASRPPLARALLFLRLTGCRLSEMCKAFWPDVDFDRGVWIVANHKSVKKTGKPKVKVLTPQAVELLESFRPDPASGPIFLNGVGLPWYRQSIDKAFRKAKRRAGVTTRGSLHGIRHRFGTAGVAAGVSIKLLSAQMGHSGVAVTERYYVDLSGEIEAIRQAAAAASAGFHP